MESEARFQSLFANASVGVALIDRNSNFLMVNDAFCGFLGFSRQEILYKEIAQFVPLEENDLEKALNDNLAGENQTCMLEQQFVRKDGETVWGQLNVSVIRDEQQDFQAQGHRLRGRDLPESERKRTAGPEPDL